MRQGERLGGSRVRKDDARIEAYATVDETNAVIGVARAAEPPPEVDALLALVQADLFVVGAELARDSEPTAESSTRLIDHADVRRLEQAIDAAQDKLPKLTGFVLPTGGRAAAALHQARTVCRRAERRVVAARAEHEARSEPVVYLNRLGDLLYVLALRCNQLQGVPEEPISGGSGGPARED